MSDDVLRTIDEVMAANAVRFHPFGPPREAPKSDDPWAKAHAAAFAGPPERWPGPGCLCSTCEALRVHMVPAAVPPPVEARPQPPTNLLGGLFGTVFSTPPPEPAPRPWWRRLLGGAR